MALPIKRLRDVAMFFYRLPQRKKIAVPLSQYASFPNTVCFAAAQIGWSQPFQCKSNQEMRTFQVKMVRMVRKYHASSRDLLALLLQKAFRIPHRVNRRLHPP